MSETLAFIGTGNMASALIHGLIADGYPLDWIIAADPVDTQLEKFAGQGITTTTDNLKAIKDADVIILAVKPQQMQSVCEQISSTIARTRPLLISIAAGISESDIAEWLGEDHAIVRAMPNTPAMIQSGATAMHASHNTPEAQKNTAESILRAVGITQWLEDEKLIDAVTALSGSGPAYYFLIMEIMAQTAEKMGLSEETAHLLTLQTALGAARMAMESSEHPAALRRKVTSPGGTTEAAINCLNENQLERIFSEAMQAAHDRSRELSARLSSR